MERRFSAVSVVVIWGLANTVFIAVLVGFVLARSGPGLDVAYYCASVALVYALAGLAWLARRRRRRGLDGGLRLAPRPAAALLFALGVALVWLGLPFGYWLPIMGAVPLAAALMMEIGARRGG